MIELLMMATAIGFPVFMTGNDLYQRCQAENRTACIAYVIGVNDAINDLAGAKALPKQFCIGYAVKPQQEADVVTNFLRDHPESRDQGAGGLTVAALMGAFPCPG